MTIYSIKLKIMIPSVESQLNSILINNFLEILMELAKIYTLAWYTLCDIRSLNYQRTLISRNWSLQSKNNRSRNKKSQNPPSRLPKTTPKRPSTQKTSQTLTTNTQFIILQDHRDT
jgi:hypothetical protein